MVEGDKWEMYIPSELGYGDGGSGKKIKGGDAAHGGGRQVGDVHPLGARLRRRRVGQEDQGWRCSSWWRATSGRCTSPRSSATATAGRARRSRVAMQLMVEGDKWEMYIPSELGYGDGGSGAKIKGGDVLVFRMEILKIKGEKKPADKCDVQSLSGCNDKQKQYVEKHQGNTADKR